jgi:hypothetical protein
MVHLYRSLFFGYRLFRSPAKQMEKDDVHAKCTTETQGDDMDKDSTTGIMFSMPGPLLS